MNVLILGGKQACGPGLPDGKSYVAQFVRRLQAVRQSVKVDFRAVTLTEANRLLPKLRLSEYDLILLQFDLPLNWLPTEPVRRLAMQALFKLSGVRIAPLNSLRAQLADLLLQVRVFNRQVVILSPLPHTQRLEKQLLQLANSVYSQACTEWQVPLFNVSQCLAGGDELFQVETADQLSAVAHELLASELHTFITEPTYTLWS
ncbi:hypothetical protein JYG30_16420 [Fibrella sp. USSR17]